MENLNQELENNELSFDSIICKTSDYKKGKDKLSKKPSTSTKPLKFNVSPEKDSPLKATLVKIINNSDLVYADLYNYCSDLKGDIDAGSRLALNIINGLRDRHSMNDRTFGLLCDFLKLDIQLVPRNIEEDYSNDEDGF